MTNEILDALRGRALLKHDDAIDWPDPDGRYGHRGAFQTCPHADCALVRRVATREAALQAIVQQWRAEALRTSPMAMSNEYRQALTRCIDDVRKLLPVSARDRTIPHD